MIGAAVIGHWVSPVARNNADPDEWIKVEGSSFARAEGYLSLRFGEPMEEVNYIDQVAPGGRGSSRGHRSVSQRAHFSMKRPFAAGRDVLTRMRTRPPGHGTTGPRRERAAEHAGSRYVRDFQASELCGLRNQHTLTLDLGQWTAANPLRLLLHGFIEYFSASSMYAAWQSDLEPMPPYVEAQLPDGSWKRVMDEMGFPAGLPRTIVSDLTGKLPPGTRRIRLKTNLQIYWDQVLIDNGPDRANQVRQTEMPLASAQACISRIPATDRRQDARRSDVQLSRTSAQTGPFITQRGSYTRYGEVTHLA